MIFIQKSWIVDIKFPVKLNLVVLSLVLLFSCNTNNTGVSTIDKDKEITIFAAASLSDVVTEIADSFAVKYNCKTRLNFASSGTLARQIEQGAGPDIYISANKKWMSYVDSLGHIVSNQLSDIAQNDLVLIAPKNSRLEEVRIDSSLDFLSILGKERFSMGNPIHVPAGRYAKQSLAYYGWFKELENQVLPAKDVRSALMVVELGETPVGIVYKTDAVKSDKVKILGIFPEKSHRVITYIAGVSSTNKLAKEFYAYLSDPEIKAVWKKYGFKN